MLFVLMIMLVVTRLAALIMVSQNAARAKSTPRVILGSVGEVGRKGGRQQVVLTVTQFAT